MKELCAKLTQKIVDALRQGVVPWRKPWGDNAQTCVLPPQNPRTGKRYSGVNVILLWLAGTDYPSPYWADGDDWKRLGGTVKAGESPSFIVAFFREKGVYNLAQVEGCSLEQPANALNYDAADKVIARCGADVRYEGDRAYYSLATDIIHCPPRNLFRTTAGFYTTVLHELSHWTAPRLHRQFGSFGDMEYAQEELVAELSSCFLAARLHVPEALAEMPNHASYIQSWLAVLKDGKAIFNAACQAQKASDYLVTRKESVCRPTRQAS